MRAWFSLVRTTLVIGLLYGAACGGLYAAALVCVLSFPHLELWGAYDVLAITIGVFLGGVGGLMFGVAGACARGPVGWAVAGALGGFSSVLCLCACIAPFDPYSWEAVIPAVIGAATGVAIGCGIRRGHSRLPGVTPLAAAMRQVDEWEEGPGFGGRTGVAPADTPPGRGDEASPAG